MAIDATIIDLDDVFRSSPNPPILVNNFKVVSDQDRREINELLLTQYQSDFLEVEPSCRCGITRGGHRKGEICPICATPVMPVTERALESSMWLALPKGVKAFINPKVCSILSNKLTFSKFNILEHLVKPDAKDPESTKHPSIQKYMRLGIPRGINYFYDHFEEILELVMTENILKKDPGDKLTGSGRLSDLQEFLIVYRDMLFCQYLPLPTRLLMITEKTAMTTFVNSNMGPAIDAARIITEIENSPTELSLKQLQSRAMKANFLLAEYTENNFNTFFDQKTGWIRHHCFGTRSHFSFRSVINSLTDPHDYREVHLPWGLAVMAFRIHLSAKLRARGWTVRETTTHLDEHTSRYSKVLDVLFKEIIAEAPGGWIPVLINRNPSLVRGSIQQLYVSKVKTDVDVRSMSLSSKVLRNFN